MGNVLSDAALEYFENNMEEVGEAYCEHYVMENGHDVFALDDRGDEVPDWFIEEYYEDKVYGGEE